MATLGTCSICGGAVQVPDMWGGSVPPTPTCASCGAKAANPYGQIIPMKEPKKQQPLSFPFDQTSTLPDQLKG